MKNSIISTVLMLLFTSGCVKNITPSIGLDEKGILPCPKGEACYSSRELKEANNYIEPMEVPEPRYSAIKKLEKVILKYDKAVIDDKKPGYIRATFSLFSFIALPVMIEFYCPEGSNKVQIKAQKLTTVPELGQIKNLVEKIKFRYFQNDVN